MNDAQIKRMTEALEASEPFKRLMEQLKANAKGVDQ